MCLGQEGLGRVTAKQQLVTEGDQRTLPPQALSTGRPIVLSAEAENQSYRVGGFQSTAGNTWAQKRLPKAELQQRWQDLKHKQGVEGDERPGSSPGRGTCPRRRHFIFLTLCFLIYKTGGGVGDKIDLQGCRENVNENLEVMRKNAYVLLLL